MFNNLFKKKKVNGLIPAPWDIVFAIFIATLVDVHGNKRNVEPSQFIHLIVNYLAKNEFSIDDHKIQDIIAGYLDYTMQPNSYKTLLDLMHKDARMKDDASYTSHLFQIANIFSSFMISAQDFITRNSK